MASTKIVYNLIVFTTNIIPIFWLSLDQEYARFSGARLVGGG